MRKYFIFIIILVLSITACTENKENVIEDTPDKKIVKIGIFTTPDVVNTTPEFRYEEEIFKEIIARLGHITGYEIEISYAVNERTNKSPDKKYSTRLRDLFTQEVNDLSVPELILLPEGIEKQKLIEDGFFQKITSEEIRLNAPLIHQSFLPSYWKHRENSGQLYGIPIKIDRVISDGGFWVVPDDYMPPAYQSVHDLGTLSEIAEYHFNDFITHIRKSGAGNLSKNDLIEYVKSNSIPTPAYFHQYTMFPQLEIQQVTAALEHETMHIIKMSGKKLVNRSRFYLDQNESMNIRQLTEEEYAVFFDQVYSLYWGGTDLMMPNLKRDTGSPTNLYRFDYNYPYGVDVQDIFSETSYILSDLDFSSDILNSHQDVRYFLIPENCKNSSEVLKFLNKMQEPETADILYYGIEGTHWQSAEPYEVSILDNNSYYNQNNLRKVLSSLTGKSEMINALFPESIKNQYRKYIEKNDMYSFVFDFSREYSRILFELFGPPSSLKIPEELMSYLLGPYSPAFEQDSAFKNVIPEIYTRINRALEEFIKIYM